MNDQDVRSFFVFLQGESHAHGMHPAEHCLSHVPLRIIIIFRAFILNIYAVATIRGLQAPLRAVLQQFALEVVRQRPHLQRASECELFSKVPLVLHNKLPCWYTLMSHQTANRSHMAAPARIGATKAMWERGGTNRPDFFTRLLETHSWNRASKAVKCMTKTSSTKADADKAMPPDIIRQKKKHDSTGAANVPERLWHCERSFGCLTRQCVASLGEMHLP